MPDGMFGTPGGPVPTRRLFESGGPTNLLIGAVPDQSLLGREGALVKGLNDIALIPTEEERRFWLKKAAIIDPDACVFYQGTYDVTVPSDEVWFVLGGWNYTIGNGDILYLRKVSRDEPLALPGGTRLKDDGVAGSAVYVCKPILVSATTPYIDPKGLYFERQARMQYLPLNTLHIDVPSGVAVETNYYKAFPTYVSKALLTFISFQDVAWTALSIPGVTSLPLHPEISDSHQLRFAESLQFPFNRSVFPGFSTDAASVSGTGNSIAGVAAVGYIELPSDW